MKKSENIHTVIKPLPRRGLGRPVIVYGIPNCDTTKKALFLLKQNNIPFSFHDYKLHAISKEKLEHWCGLTGWEVIFNKRSTTWRELSEAEQKKIIDQPSAIRLMMGQTSIIKRPIIEFKNELIVGFNEKAIKQLNHKIYT